MAKEISKKVVDQSRLKLVKIFDKLSTDDLFEIVYIYTHLGIQGPCLSIALEVLDGRNFNHGVRKHRKFKIF